MSADAIVALIVPMARHSCARKDNIECLTIGISEREAHESPEERLVMQSPTQLMKLAAQAWTVSHGLCCSLTGRVTDRSS